MAKTMCQETQSDTMTNHAVARACQHPFVFMFCINNNVFSSTLYFDVFINNIVVANCKSTLGGGLYM